MSADGKIREAVKITASVESYDRILKAVHWLTLALIAAAYAAVWASHVVTIKEPHAILLQLHGSLGVTVFGLTLFRLGWRWRARIPGLPADLPAIQKLAARAIEYLLYMLLLVQPILGILHINARGTGVNVFFFGELPAFIGPDKALAKQAMAAHDLLANLLLAVIALHAAAALFHHFVRRDDVLNAVLPGRDR